MSALWTICVAPSPGVVPHVRDCASVGRGNEVGGAFWMLVLALGVAAVVGFALLVLFADRAALRALREFRGPEKRRGDLLR